MPAPSTFIPPGTPTPGGPWVSPAMYPVPVKPDYEAPYSNPAYSVPGPMPSGYPPSFWIGTPQYLTFGTPDPAFGPIDGVISRAVYQSPIFDLRPWLRASMPEPPNEALAIWHPSPGISLQISGEPDIETALGVNQIACWYLDVGHVSTAQRVRRLHVAQEVTAQLYDGDQSAVFPYAIPTGLRYWRVVLVFDLRSGVAPTLYAEGAVL